MTTTEMTRRADACRQADCACHDDVELNPMLAYLPLGGFAYRLAIEGCAACGCRWSGEGVSHGDA